MTNCATQASPNMNRRNFLRFVSTASVTAWLSACKSIEEIGISERKRNVLFIAVDDLRPQLACYGHRQMLCPNIDRLASRGVVFSRCYCQVPVCGASRASLLTGVRPTRDRFVNYKARADDDAPEVLTLPQYFKNNGYYTISNGKIFHERFEIGFTGKSIYQRLFHSWASLDLPIFAQSSTGWAADFGMLYRLWGMNIGGSVQNLGTNIRYSSSDSFYRLPLRIRGSVSIEPLILLDSLYRAQTVKIFDKSIHEVVNLKFNYDRAYDPYEPDDIWESYGFEVTLLNFFSYRTGEWNSWGSSRGVGFNFRNVEIDIAKYFDLNTYLVQLTFQPISPPDNIKINLKLHRSLIAASSLLAPGCGQFYKGEGIKGSLFFVPGMVLGKTILTSDSDSDKIYAAVGLIALYIGAGIEALLID